MLSPVPGVRGPGPRAALDESGFPFGSGAAHTQSVPFTRALGTQWLGLRKSDGGVLACLHLPCRPMVCDEQGAVDRRAIVALLDHSGAPACYGAKASTGATATLDLRVDFVNDVRPHVDIVVESRCVVADGRSALVAGTAVHADDRTPVARMSGRYVVGLGPGRANDSSETPAARAASAARYADSAAPAVQSFDQLLGGCFEGQDFRLAFEPWLVGSVALPALHGGVVASGLMNAAQRVVPADSRLRLASVDFLFLRAGLAEDTRFAAHVLKNGARAVYIAAEATQQDDRRRAASLQALYA